MFNYNCLVAVVIFCYSSQPLWHRVDNRNTTKNWGLTTLQPILFLTDWVDISNTEFENFNQNAVELKTVIFSCFSYKIILYIKHFALPDVLCQFFCDVYEILSLIILKVAIMLTVPVIALLERGKDENWTIYIWRKSIYKYYFW